MQTLATEMYTDLIGTALKEETCPAELEATVANRIRSMVLELGNKTLEAFEQSVMALRRRDASKGARVVVGDDEIDALELRIQREGASCLISDMPTIEERLFLLAALHISHSLERVADHAVDIAMLACELNLFPPFVPPEACWEMSRITHRLLAASIASFLEGNVRLSYRTCAEDEQVDTYHTHLSATLLSLVNENPRYATQAIYHLLALAHFERVADLATDVCERVIHWRTGYLDKLNVSRDYPRDNHQTGHPFDVSSGRSKPHTMTATRREVVDLEGFSG